LNPVDTNSDLFFISHDKSLLQVEKIHQFLSTEAYWCLGIPKEVVQKSIESSLCFGVYENKSKSQVGFARVVTDKATFAWLCDVYIEAEYRKRGLSRRLMETIKAHPDLQNLRRFCLTTRDAHDVYNPFGFEVTKTPTYWMEIKDPTIYQRVFPRL
jgi:N-acetylglutamate synthase-like GNAT family acetyltransferase